MLRGHLHTSLFRMLCVLTVFAIIAQIALFSIHTKMTDLIDSLVNSSIPEGFHYVSVLLPMMAFLSLQLLAYFLVTLYVWFITVGTGHFLRYSQLKTYLLGIITWVVTVGFILLLNQYYYPHSFFSSLVYKYPFLFKYRQNLIYLSFSFIYILTLAAYISAFYHRYHRRLGIFFLSATLLLVLVNLFDDFTFTRRVPQATTSTQPNVIVIGLDSLRPDFVGYYNEKRLNTPNLDRFLKGGTAFSEVYSPLARTFPAWASILTGKYPLHNNARNNLGNPFPIIKNDTVAKALSRSGYETIYATDEKRFSNITKDYGFDQLIGPRMGVNDFLIGSLSDYPLTNLIVNLPMGRWLFPYNYANRAVNFTYDPDHFLSLINKTLNHTEKNKPIFFAAHLCLSHWPYTWARDGQQSNLILYEQYRRSVQAVDRQFGKLMHLLKGQGLLSNSIVVVLSDHGTALGMLGDRSLTSTRYIGDRDKLHDVPVYKVLTRTSKNSPEWALDTSYGQGNDLFSFSQQQVVFGIKGYGVSIPKKEISTRAGLIDLAPTVLDLARVPAMNDIDGVSLAPQILSGDTSKSDERVLFLETGDKIGEIETDKIEVNKVIKKRINSYEVDVNNGLLYLNDVSERSLIKNKQRGILYQDWLLVEYPAQVRSQLVAIAKDSKELKMEKVRVDPFFILLNVKTNQWTTDLGSIFAQTAPVLELKQKLKDFYQGEMLTY